MIQRLSALDHTGPENILGSEVDPYQSGAGTGNDYRVYTNRGTPVVAWVAYNGSVEQNNSWCHGFSLGTFARWGYSVYSGDNVGAV